MTLPIAPESLSAFVILWFLAAAAPGGNSAFTLSVSSRHGFWTGIAGAVGLQVASFAYVLMVAAGLDALLTASATAFEVLKWVGVAYLLWLGWKTWTADVDTRAQAAHEGVLRRQAFGRGFMICLTNPKVMIAYAVIYPQFMNLEAAAAPQLATLGAASILSSMVVHTLYSGIGSYIGRFTRTPRMRRINNRIFGGIFAGAGVLLAATSRGTV